MMTNEDQYTVILPSMKTPLGIVYWSALAVTCVGSSKNVIQIKMIDAKQMVTSLCVLYRLDRFYKIKGGGGGGGGGQCKHMYENRNPSVDGQQNFQTV